MPAAAVIPAPLVYIVIAAVKKLVVESESRTCVRLLALTYVVAILLVFCCGLRFLQWLAILL